MELRQFCRKTKNVVNDKPFIAIKICDLVTTVTYGNGKWQISISFLTIPKFGTFLSKFFYETTTVYLNYDSM